MRKLIWIISCLLISINVANAQALLILLFGDKLSTEKFQMGINADLSYSNLNGLDGTKYRLDWAFGAFGEIRLNDHWSLQPEITVKTPAGAKEIPGLTPGVPILDSLFNGVSVTRKMNYLTVPIYVKYKTGKFGFALGPQIGYLTGATDHYEGSTILGDQFTLQKGVTGQHNRWDAGATVLLDFIFKPQKKMRSMR
ncbi:MAG: PorT family protein, partial [Calditrichia bacterium]|nr:PorT family protein [Calditrichia bacterium]